VTIHRVLSNVRSALAVAATLTLCMAAPRYARAQQPPTPATAQVSLAMPSAEPPAALPSAPQASAAAQAGADAVASGQVSGEVTDTDSALIPNAAVSLIDVQTPDTHRDTVTDPSGTYRFDHVPPGTYRVRIAAKGFSSWKVKDFTVAQDQAVTLDRVELGVEAITTAVSAITVEALAEEQITNEEHQRILGILPNFYVTYEKNPMPLTPRQKFKLGVVVMRDPLTFITAGINAGIEQANGDYADYGPGIGGYGKRYAAAYGDHLTATFLGSAFFPTLFRQDPRYFYRGHGRIITRALYAISTTVICKGDNGKWQPNYSNVLGNFGSAEIATLYYPATGQQSAQVRATNTAIGIAEGSISTLFQEFILRRFTTGGIAKLVNHK
jgi:hypothetical protein